MDLFCPFLSDDSRHLPDDRQTFVSFDQDENLCANQNRANRAIESAKVRGLAPLDSALRMIKVKSILYLCRAAQGLLAACILLIPILTHAQQQTPLDRTLAPQGDDTVSNVFRDMGVVQRRAMTKSGRFLFSNYGALDFSDGPYSMYGFNLNPGYAISDFWEIYVNAVPFFISNPRSIVGLVEQLKLDNGQSAKIDFVKPKYQIGGEILWAPAYGKDSIGKTRVLRSDTFFKIGAMQIFYEGNLKGLKFHAGVGKTYFLTNWLGFRIAATGNYMQTIVDSTKNFKFFAIVEAGLVFYL